MQALHTDRAIAMSEFKKNPAAVLRAAEGRPVAVLNHNRVAFYLLEPGLLERLLDQLAAAQGGDGQSGSPASHAQLLQSVLSQHKTAPAQLG